MKRHDKFMKKNEDVSYEKPEKKKHETNTTQQVEACRFASLLPSTS